MSFVNPQPCVTEVDEDGQCCPNTFIGFCLDDGTPISITIQAGAQLGWTNLLTGIFTPGPPPAGTVVCSAGTVNVGIDCLTHSITVCQNEDPWVVTGTVTIVEPITVDAVDFDIRNLVFATDKVDVSGSTIITNYEYPEDSPHTSTDIGAFVLAVRNDAGTPLAADGDYIPFTTDNTGALRVNATFSGDITVALDCATDSVTICPGDDPIDVIGTVTVNQGTSPWVIGDGGGSITVDAVDLDIRNLVFATDKVDVTGSTIALDAGTLAALETITVLQGTSPWVVSGTVELGAATLAALETITVLQGTSPWVVSGTITADTNFDYPEDSPHISGDIGAFTLGVRNDAADTLTTTNGDYSPFAVDAAGRIGISDLGGSITVDGTVAVTQSTSPWVVSGTVELGAATLAALETITVLQGTSPWVVSATDLDIRNLVCGQDSVDACVTFDYAEDSPHVSGDIGALVLAVRNDAGTPLAANLDYIPFTTDATGALRVTGGSGVFQHEEILCDDDVTFIRKYIQDEDGVVLSVVDLDLEGDPYVVVGIVQVCGGDAPVTPQTLDSTVDRLTGAGTISVSSGSKSVTVIVLSGSPTVEIDADPAITLVPGMALTWGVDDRTESLLNAFTFTGFGGSDIFVHTTSGPLAAIVLDSTVERLAGVGSVIIAAGASSITITVISGLPTVTIGGGPAITLTAGMSMSWSVDADQEDLSDVFTFTGVSGSDFVVTSTRV